MTNEENPTGWRRTILDDPYRERFLAKARALGIRFSEEAERKGSSPRWPSVSSLAPRLAAGLAIVVLAAASIFTYQGLKREIERQGARIAGLDEELSALSGKRALLQSRLAAETQSTASRESEIANLRNERVAAIARANDLEGQLTKAKTNTDALQVELAQSSVTTGDLQSRLQADERRLANSEAEAHDLRVESASHVDNTTALRTEVEQLSAQLKAARETDARDQQLLAAGKDIRDLMGARQLHVIDVFDANGEGNNSKVFGRVFYTEGKSLVFYAFNLGHAEGASGRVSYVAWGKQQDAATPARELGIFYVDNVNQQRWVLRFDNPMVLREISSVFVTIEHDNVSQRPTGQPLLYAYLHTPANHP